MDVKNSRGPERFLLTEPLPGSFGSASITILNISIDGLKIEHAQPIRLGTRARLWFKRADISVSVQAVVVWSHLSKTPNDKGKLLYNSGMRIETGGDEYSLAVQSLVHRGIAELDTESLDRKRRRAMERAKEKSSTPTMKIIRQEEDIPADQVLLIQQARERLRTHPDEAMKWYNRAKYAITQGGTYVATEMRNREDVLAVWEYLERTIDLSTIVRIFEKTRTSTPG
jgi:hypothetical protein